MGESDRRIVLWRNTIALFHERKRPEFIGPFRKAGYAYRVETALSVRRTGDEKSKKRIWSIIDPGVGLIGTLRAIVE